MSFTAAFDPFEALGLPRDASDQNIKSAYHSLARRYHPNRSQGTEQERHVLSQHFYQIHHAWRLLRTANHRRRQAELLNLLELHHEMLVHFAEFLNSDASSDQHRDPPGGEDATQEDDGHVSSDADEDDLPHVGIQRRRTVLRPLSRGASPGRGQGQRESPAGLNGSADRAPRGAFRDLPTLNVDVPDDPPKPPDYFTLRRKKQEKLKRAELQAFQEYREAMIAKFDAEEEAENRQELYERAKWKREYFERAPREIRERLKTFRGFMGAFRVLSALGHKDITKGNAASFEVSSPVVGMNDKNQFLRPDNMLLRRKSFLKRGYSNDISGDQTSSDSDSGSGTGTRKIAPLAPLASQNALVRRGRAAEAHVARHSAKMRDTESCLNGLRPTKGEFKLVVRQPTELKGMTVQDSGADSGSESSRTPSPHSISQEKAFTLVPSTGAAALFRINPEARSRSPSPGGHRRTTSLHGGTPEVHLHTTDSCQFDTKTISTIENRIVPYEHVHVLSTTEKAWMLGSPPDTDADPTVVMERLNKLNRNVARKYCIKSDMMEEFAFRLVYDRPDFPKSEYQSFIALSYRRKLHVDKCNGYFTLPLEDEIFQAVWDERRSHTEGLWIDQICIDQDSERERTVSMSAMDLVYRSARLIVVALDDLELAYHEGQLLQDHMTEYQKMVYVAPRQRFRRKQPPWLESHDDLYQVVRKILKSSWFRRAWCRHEMRLAKNHIFLIPCKRPDHRTGRDILRFDAKCIAHLLELATEVPFESEVESIKPALYAFFRDRAKMLPGETKMRAHHGNFSAVVAEVFAMEAGGDPRIPEAQRASDARKDKVSIILNTMECGLALEQELRAADKLLSENECYHDLLLVALAAQDPGALCSVGAPLPITGVATSWMFQPTVADSGLNNFKTLARIPANAEFVTYTSPPEHYIQLDLKVLKRDLATLAVSQKDPDRLALAHRFIEICDQREWGRNRKRYLMNDRRAKLLFGSMRDVYAETLACVFACGPTWMSDVCQRYSVSGWRIDVHGAFELMIALQNTFGRWPPHAWNERAAGFLMDFVNFLVIRGLPQRQLSKPEPWRPVWSETRPGRPGKVITFVPLNRDICTAVPTVLAQPDYVHLARMWILEPRRVKEKKKTGNEDEEESEEEEEESSEEEEEEAENLDHGDCNEWTLLGRSVVFSDEESVEHMHQIDSEIRTHQKVFGRRV